MDAGVAPAASTATSAACPIAMEVRKAPQSASLIPPAPPESFPSKGQRQDYRHSLQTTAVGWPRLDQWCLWIEPPAPLTSSSGRDLYWYGAVRRALGEWRELLRVTQVADPRAAQVHVRRRLPPLGRGPDGRTRASHGRALLQLVEVNRQGRWRLEPHVEVLIGVGQRQEVLRATALHELGHAFGLWGHSSDPTDAMAEVPVGPPVVTLSARDRATMAWLVGQPTVFGVAAPQPQYHQDPAARHR